MPHQIYSKAFLVQQVRKYAQLQAPTCFGWRETNDLPDSELLDIINCAEAYDVPTAIFACQGVANAFNED